MFAKFATTAFVVIAGLLLPTAVFASPATPELLDARGRTNGVSTIYQKLLPFRSYVDLILTVLMTAMPI